MARHYFTDCDLRKLSGVEFAQLFVCRALGKAPLWEYHDELCHVDLECDEVPCCCALALKPWEDGWSKMPKRPNAAQISN
jgi:hypothetical protein